MVLPTESIIAGQYRQPTNTNGPLPEISTDLESVRAYQFEVNFRGFPALQSDGREITVAAKRVGAISYGVESIPVDRLNDKVFYPGKATPEPLEIEFDNLLLKNTTEKLWQAFKEVYSPVTGKAGFRAANGIKYKGDKMTIVELNGDNVPIGGIELYGVYPEKVAFSEKNYSTSEFSTVAVTFRYDFINFSRRPTYQGANAGNFANGTRPVE
jgi:hypothetical protein